MSGGARASRRPGGRAIAVGGLAIAVTIDPTRPCGQNVADLQAIPGARDFLLPMRPIFFHGRRGGRRFVSFGPVARAVRAGLAELESVLRAGGSPEERGN